MTFNELPLHEQVLEGTQAANFQSCMPVQEMVLPITLQGRDVMVQSKTGSGKTAVYIITFLEKFLRNRESGTSSSCLIIAPTRELAQQISDDAMLLCSKVKGFHIGVFYGGVGYEHQRKLLQMGCDIYVGTPGRILEFMGSHELDTHRIDTFVIDEADRLFDMGFYPDIKRMFRKLPDKTKRQTLLFSATLEMRVRNLAWEFMNDPEEIDLQPDQITVESITQELYHVAKSDKFYLFLQLLASIKPSFALIFTNSKHMAEELCARLRLNGYNANYLTGDLPQSQRQRALDNLKDGKTNFLVATDVAARGLQIDDLPLVVNYDIPEDYENYVHRIGRTARAGKSGKAITLADEEFVYGLEAIEKYIKMKIPVIWPDNLPQVVDQSVGKSWRLSSNSPAHSGRPERSERAKSGKKSSKPANNGKPSSATKSSASVSGASLRNASFQNSSAKPQKLKQKYSADRTNTKSLGAMTEQERMAYYRKKYGFQPRSETAPKPKPSTTNPTTPQSEPTPQPSAPVSTVSSQSTATEQITEQKSKKKGFFRRLFGGKSVKK